VIDHTIEQQAVLQQLEPRWARGIVDCRLHVLAGSAMR
jgi:hypothetical protein